MLLESSYNKDFFQCCSLKLHYFQGLLASINITMTHLTHLGSEFRNEFLENFKLNNYRNTKEQNPFYEHKEQRLAKECPRKNICIHLNICGKSMVLFIFKL